VVEHRLAKARVASSSLVSRSIPHHPGRNVARCTAEWDDSGPTHGPRRGTQVVRERSAKPLCAGSIPARASNDLQQQFASDNYAGICPEAWAAMEAANRGHVTSYGDDPWTAKAADAFRSLFETDCEVYFVFNGTAANSLALASLCQSYHGVICCDQSHVETDECGAPEFFSNGSKLLVAASADGKLTPASIHELATKRQDIHYPKPRAVTITQSTETGACTRSRNWRDLRGVQGAGLSLHMDGARFANACASLGCSPAEMTWKSGVDVLCFGGAKNGMAVGEAVLFFDRALATDFDYRCKQAGNWRRRCGFSRRRGWECWRAARGCATPSTPTAARSSSLCRLRAFPASSGAAG
jgi:threonine aldolase